GAGSGVASVAGAIRRFRRCGSGRRGGEFPLSSYTGTGARFLYPPSRATGRGTPFRGPMRRWLPLLLAWSAAAHVISMSSGDLTIDGAKAHYVLRMPLYEAAHVKDPAQTLLDHVRFEGAKLISRQCREDQPTDSFICDADYVFASPMEQVEVECTLASV